MELEELYRKYRILTDGLKRLYIVDTDDKKLDMDSVEPLLLTIFIPQLWDKNAPIAGVEQFACNSWKGLLTNLVKYFLENTLKSREELLNFSFSWTEIKPFKETKDIVNVVKLNNGLYFSVNHSANHSFWAIQELMDLFGACGGQLVIHRPSHSEPKEVCDMIKKLRLSQFKDFLCDIKSLPEEKADKIVKTINGPFNKLLRESRTSNNDFFLFDNCLYLSNYKSKFISSLLHVTTWDEKKIAVARKYLDYLTEFYGALSKEAKHHKDGLVHRVNIL